MRNPGLDETQVEIKIARRNINNLRYVDDTTHMAESKEELNKGLLDEGQSFLFKASLKVSIKKLKIVHLEYKGGKWKQ